MFVVTGATGNVGGELVRLLAAAGERVTAVSRRPGPLPEGVRHSAGDLGDPASLKAAFDGAGALFLLVAGHEPHAVLEAAKAGGVERVVLLSSQGAGTRPGLYGHPAAFEEAVRGSGAGLDDPAAGRLRLQRPGLGRADPCAPHGRRAVRRRRPARHRPGRHRRGRLRGAAPGRARRAYVRAHRPAARHPARAGSRDRAGDRRAGALRRAEQAGGPRADAGLHARAGRRGHPHHPRHADGGGAAGQPGRGTPPGPRPTPLRHLGHPQPRGLPVTGTSARPLAVPAPETLARPGADSQAAAPAGPPGPQVRGRASGSGTCGRASGSGLSRRADGRAA
ncbi:SDR family oxidoreductase [Nonomuraea rubra]|uniref:SDR family oxidoreductase n=1 Tax=Nonomuraea rubra TaxID=46180 RepID=UPI0031EDCE19